MHTALLDNCDDIFNYEEMVFLTKNLEKKFEMMREFYSSTFINFIRHMTQEREEDRSDFVGLSDHLDQILKMNKDDVFYFLFPYFVIFLYF